MFVNIKIVLDNIEIVNHNIENSITHDYCQCTGLFANSDNKPLVVLSILNLEPET